MEAVNEINEYLPIRYKTPVDLDYFERLFASVSKNHENEDYHFSLTALHMLYMGIVYHNLYKFYKYSPKKFDLILIGFHNNIKPDKIDDLSWQSLSKIKERSIFEFYRSLGCDSEIGEFKRTVDDRNDLVHTNGKYVTEEDIFSERSKYYLRCTKKIEEKSADIVLKLFNKYLRSIKVSIFDEEAKEYLYKDFIVEYGISMNNLKKLKSIVQSAYPCTRSNARLIKKALVEICG